MPSRRLVRRLHIVRGSSNNDRDKTDNSDNATTTSNDNNEDDAQYDQGDYNVRGDDSSSYYSPTGEPDLLQYSDIDNDLITNQELNPDILSDRLAQLQSVGNYEDKHNLEATRINNPTLQLALDYTTITDYQNLVIEPDNDEPVADLEDNNNNDSQAVADHPQQTIPSSPLILHEVATIDLVVRPNLLEVVLYATAARGVR